MKTWCYLIWALWSILRTTMGKGDILSSAMVLTAAFLQVVPGTVVGVEVMSLYFPLDAGDLSLAVGFGLAVAAKLYKGGSMNKLKLWMDEQGQDIAEYAVMLAVILVIVIGTIKLIGNSANQTFSTVASSLQGAGSNQ